MFRPLVLESVGLAGVLVLIVLAALQPVSITLKKRAGKFMFRKVVFLILALVFSVSGMVNAKEAGQSERLKASLPNLQVPFIENKRQVHEEVAYYAKTFGGTVFITKDGRIVYNLQDGSRKIEHLKGNNKAENKADKEPLKAAALYETFVGGSINAVKGEVPSKAKVSYFKGNDPSKWQSGLSTYDLISLGEVYNGIEVKLKAHGNNVEKLFYVKPGASPEAINMRIEGTIASSAAEGSAIRVNDQGELEVATDLGAVRFTKPVAYQEIDGRRVEVEVSYKVNQSQNSDSQSPAFYAFNVGEYDKTRTLIIDPLLASTFIGRIREDWGYSIALDSTGYVYVTGRTWSFNYPTTPGAYDTSHNRYPDVFVSKLDRDLSQLLASTFIGGSDTDYVHSIALDSTGHVYVTGATYSSDYPTTPGAYDTSHNRYADVFVSKLDRDLSQLLASTFIGGGGDDYGYSIALDSTGHVYVTGGTWSSNYPTTPGAYDTDHNGDGDVFVSRLDGSLSDGLADTVTIRNAVFFIPLSLLFVSATSTAAPEAELFVTVPGCVTDTPMSPRGSRYVFFTRACTRLDRQTATVRSSFGGSAEAVIR